MAFDKRDGSVIRMAESIYESAITAAEECYWSIEYSKNGVEHPTSYPVVGLRKQIQERFSQFNDGGHFPNGQSKELIENIRFSYEDDEKEANLKIYVDRMVETIRDVLYILIEGGGND